MTATLIVALVFGVAAFAFVGWPLFVSRGVVAITEPNETLSALRGRRDRIYEALRELQFDERMGKITSLDHADLSERYKRQAVELLKQLDDKQRDALLALDAEIEHEVKTYRAGRSVTLRKVDSTRKIRCVACGAPLEEDDRFCRRCGVPISSACPRCKAKIAAGDKHCSKCGAKL